MILVTKKGFFLVKTPAIKDVLSILKRKKVIKTRDLTELQRKYGRRKIYTILRLLDKYNIIEVRKTLFPKRLVAYYRAKELYFIEASLITAIISSTILYMISLYMLHKSLTIGIFGFVVGILSTISLFLILYVKMILEKLEVL